MNNKNNTVILSIITVSYNNDTLLEKTIQNIHNQTFKKFEHIIIDGGSTDRTLEIIHKYDNQISKFLSEPDKGIYDAMNKGIELASGEWICFINCGDTFTSKDVLKQIFLNEIGKKVSVLYGDVILQFKSGEIYKKVKQDNKSMPQLYHQSTFIKTELLKKRKFDTKYKICADYDLAVYLFKEGYIFKKVDVPVVYYDMNGYSAENLMTYYEEKTEIDGMKSNTLYINLVVKSLIRTYFPKLIDYLHFKILYLKTKLLS